MAKRQVPDLGLTPAETAVALHVGESTVRRWFEAGRLPGIRIGGRIIISVKGLENLLEHREQPAHPWSAERQGTSGRLRRVR